WTALLGGAHTKRLGRWKPRGAQRKRAAGYSATARRLQANGHRRTATGESERLGSLFRQSAARDEHHAAMGGLMLVLLKILRSAERSAFRWRRVGALLDGRGQTRGRAPFFAGN